MATPWVFFFTQAPALAFADSWRDWLLGRAFTLPDGNTAPALERDGGHVPKHSPLALLVSADPASVLELASAPSPVASSLPATASSANTAASSAKTPGAVNAGVSEGVAAPEPAAFGAAAVDVKAQYLSTATAASVADAERARAAAAATNPNAPAHAATTAPAEILTVRLASAATAAPAALGSAACVVYTGPAAVSPLAHRGRAHDLFAARLRGAPVPTAAALAADAATDAGRVRDAAARFPHSTHTHTHSRKCIHVDAGTAESKQRRAAWVLRATAALVLPRVWAFEHGAAGKRVYVVASLGAFVRRFVHMKPEHAAYYEVVRAGAPVRPYLDIELTCDDQSNTYITNNDHAQLANNSADGGDQSGSSAPVYGSSDNSSSSASATAVDAPFAFPPPVAVVRVLLQRVWLHLLLLRGVTFAFQPDCDRSISGTDESQVHKKRLLCKTHAPFATRAGAAVSDLDATIRGRKLSRHVVLSLPDDARIAAASRTPLSPIASREQQSKQTADTATTAGTKGAAVNGDWELVATTATESEDAAVNRDGKHAATPDLWGDLGDWMRALHNAVRFEAEQAPPHTAPLAVDTTACNNFRCAAPKSGHAGRCGGLCLDWARLCDRACDGERDMSANEHKQSHSGEFRASDRKFMFSDRERGGAWPLCALGGILRSRALPCPGLAPSQSGLATCSRSADAQSEHPSQSRVPCVRCDNDPLISLPSLHTPPRSQSNRADTDAFDHSSESTTVTRLSTAVAAFARSLCHAHRHGPLISATALRSTFAPNTAEANNTPYSVNSDSPLNGTTTSESVSALGAWAVDTGVYTRNRCFRLLGAAKRGRAAHPLDVAPACAEATADVDVAASQVQGASDNEDSESIATAGDSKRVRIAQTPPKIVSEVKPPRCEWSRAYPGLMALTPAHVSASVAVTGFDVDAFYASLVSVEPPLLPTPPPRATARDRLAAAEASATARKAATQLNGVVTLPPVNKTSSTVAAMINPTLPPLPRLQLLCSLASCSNEQAFSTGAAALAAIPVRPPPSSLAYVFCGDSHTYTESGDGASFLVDAGAALALPTLLLGDVTNTGHYSTDGFWSHASAQSHDNQNDATLATDSNSSLSETGTRTTTTTTVFSSTDVASPRVWPLYRAALVAADTALCRALPVVASLVVAQQQQQQHARSPLSNSAFSDTHSPFAAGARFFPGTSPVPAAEAMLLRHLRWERAHLTGTHTGTRSTPTSSGSVTLSQWGAGRLCAAPTTNTPAARKASPASAAPALSGATAATATVGWADTAAAATVVVRSVEVEFVARGAVCWHKRAPHRANATVHALRIDFAPLSHRSGNSSDNSGASAVAAVTMGSVTSVTTVQRCFDPECRGFTGPEVRLDNFDYDKPLLL